MRSGTKPFRPGLVMVQSVWPAVCAELRVRTQRNEDLCLRQVSRACRFFFFFPILPLSPPISLFALSLACLPVASLQEEEWANILARYRLQVVLRTFAQKKAHTIRGTNMYVVWKASSRFFLPLHGWWTEVSNASAVGSCPRMIIS